MSSDLPVRMVAVATIVKLDECGHVIEEQEHKLTEEEVMKLWQSQTKA